MTYQRGASTRESAPECTNFEDFDDDHTTVPALAGLASKTATPPAVSRGVNDQTSTRRSQWRRRIAAAGAVLVALGTFSATTPASAATTTANQVSAHGAKNLGSPPAELAEPAVGIAATPSRDGYWVVASDGGIFGFGAAPFYGSTGAIQLARPVVGMAATPSGEGYWLVADDGGVFSFGDARFYGSLGGTALNAPIVGIAASPTGDGYWLVGNDGGVFSFGDAKFFGSTGAIRLVSPVAGMTATEDGTGYLLVARDGGVFAFGDAHFAGSAADPAASPAVGIARSGDGYVIARENGGVAAFEAPYHGDATGYGDAPIVGIALADEGYWLARGVQPPPDLSGHPFLSCTRKHESDTSGGYRAVSASGTYRGAYQFSQSTWNSTAREAGRPDLVGVDPATAAPADQDTLALLLYQWQGSSPWGGRCSGL
jgi:hypothetical protein